MMCEGEVDPLNVADGYAAMYCAALAPGGEGAAPLCVTRYPKTRLIRSDWPCGMTLVEGRH